MICGGESARRYSESGFEVIQHRVAYQNTLGPVARMRSFAAFMTKATLSALRTPADILFASSTPLTVAVPAIVASTTKRIPYIFEVRDLWPEVPIELGYVSNRFLIRAARILESMAYRRSRYTIALSPTMASGVRRVSPNTAVEVIPNSSDLSTFRKTDEERQAIRERLGWRDLTSIVYAGSLGQIYGTDWIVEVAYHMQDVPVHFTVIGEGYGLQHLKSASRQLNNITVTGPLPKIEVAEYVSAADMALSTVIDAPTLEGSSLNKVFDALAADRPVVFNHGGWLSDLLVSRGAGWRLPRDTRSAARELRRLLAQNLDLQAYQSAARSLGEEFARDDHYRQLARIIQLAGSDAKGPRR